MSELNKSSTSSPQLEDSRTRLEVNQRINALLKNGNLPEALEIIKRVLIQRVLDKDRRRDIISSILLDDKQDYKIDSKLVGVNLVKTILNGAKKNPMKSIGKLKAEIPEINKTTPKLAQYVSIICGGEKVDPLLARIHFVFTKFQLSQIFEHFKQYYKEYLIRASDENTKQILQKVVLKFLIEYAKRKKEDRIIQTFQRTVESWKEPFTDIRIYARSAVAYLNQLKSFNDLIIDLKDGDSSITQLVHYEDEIILFQKIMQMVQRGMQEGDWKDFMSFYHEVDSIAKRLENEFGDVVSARLLLETKKKFHESPNDWLRILNTVLIRLQNNRDILVSAKRALIVLCLENKKRIEKSINEERSKVVHALEKEMLLEGVKRPAAVLSKVKKVTKRLERELKERIKIKREQYKEAENEFKNGLYELQKISQEIANKDLTKYGVFFKAVNQRHTQLKQREELLLKIQNPESPTGIARISEGASRFYAYENELKVRTEQTKTKARANLWSELPSLFLEFLRIIDGVEKQLDKLLLILQNIQSRQFAHDRVR